MGVWFDNVKTGEGPMEWNDCYGRPAHMPRMKKLGYVKMTDQEVEDHKKGLYVPQMLTKIEDIDIEAVYAVRDASAPGHMQKAVKTKGKKAKADVLEEAASPVIDDTPKAKAIVKPVEEIGETKPEPKPEKTQLVKRTKAYKAQIELVKNGDRTLKDVQKEYKLSPAAIKEFKAL